MSRTRDRLGAAAYFRSVEPVVLGIVLGWVIRGVYWSLGARRSVSHDGADLGSHLQVQCYRAAARHRRDVF